MTASADDKYRAGAAFVHLASLVRSALPCNFHEFPTVIRRGRPKKRSEKGSGRKLLGNESRRERVSSTAGAAPQAILVARVAWRQMSLGHMPSRLRRPLRHRRESCSAERMFTGNVDTTIYPIAEAFADCSVSVVLDAIDRLSQRRQAIRWHEERRCERFGRVWIKQPMLPAGAGVPKELRRTVKWRRSHPQEAQRGRSPE